MPSPRKYHVASISHSSTGDHLVDSVLGKDTDNVKIYYTSLGFLHAVVMTIMCMRILIIVWITTLSSIVYGVQGPTKLGVTKTDLDIWTERSRKASYMSFTNNVCVYTCTFACV